jgi:hypothetical protein
MNFSKLTDFAIVIVMAALISGRLPELNRWVHLQTAKLLYSSRSSTWGSPRFFSEHRLKSNITAPKSKEVQLTQRKTHSN